MHTDRDYLSTLSLSTVLAAIGTKTKQMVDHSGSVIGGMVVHDTWWKVYHFQRPTRGKDRAVRRNKQRCEWNLGET